MSYHEGLAARALATAGVMLATLTISLDTTIANVALPHMRGSLSAGQDQITWVLTSYIVATAMMTPLTGWLAVRWGRKRLFLISIIVFVAASVLCGMAETLPEMVALRVLQGIGGCAMVPLSQASLFDLWSPAQIPRMMSIWAVGATVGPVLGPTVGGFLTENYSWRLVFYINVPIGIVSFLAIALAMAPDKPGQKRSFDLLGFIAFVMFSVGVQLVLDRGPSQDWLDSPEVGVEAFIAACGLYVFVLHTLTTKAPFFHPDVIGNRNLWICLTILIATTGVLYSTAALLPTFLQGLLGYSALQSGLAVMPRGVGAIVAFVLAPFAVERVGPRVTVASGMLMTIIGLWLLTRLDPSMTARPIEQSGFLLGFGQGLMINPLAVLVFATIPGTHRTEAAVFSNTIRTLGGSFGIAIAQAVLIRQSAAAHETLGAHVIASDPIVRWRLPELFGGGFGVEAINAEVTRQADAIAYNATFAWLALAAVCMLPMVVLVRSARRLQKERAAVHVD